MKRKEFKVGEVFQCGLIKLKCEKEQKTRGCCDGCFFHFNCFTEITSEIAGPCNSLRRKDKTSVIFVKVED